MAHHSPREGVCNACSGPPPWVRVTEHGGPHVELGGRLRLQWQPLPTVSGLGSFGSDPKNEESLATPTETIEPSGHGSTRAPAGLRRLDALTAKYRVGAELGDTRREVSSAASVRPTIPTVSSQAASPRPAPSSRTAPVVQTLPIVGIWVPSGWMGDAERPDGTLSYRLVGDDPSTQGTYDEWSYDPIRGGSKGWVAVAYQFPDSNWGDAPGKHLSRRGFTHLTFRARCLGPPSGQTLLIKSGGHTRPGAPYPASFESDPVIVKLDKSWRTYSVLLDGLDLSNVPAAFTFVLRASSSGPCVIDLADIRFSGPGD